VRRAAATALGATLGEQANSRKRHVEPADKREVMVELVRLLDDKGDVRRAALASLEQIGGEVSDSEEPVTSVSGERLSTADVRANRWKQWLRNHQSP
jgi:HEAT repeat protein